MIDQDAPFSNNCTLEDKIEKAALTIMRHAPDHQVVIRILLNWVDTEHGTDEIWMINVLTRKCGFDWIAFDWKEGATTFRRDLRAALLRLDPKFIVHADDDDLEFPEKLCGRAWRDEVVSSNVLNLV